MRVCVCVPMSRKTKKKNKKKKCSIVGLADANKGTCDDLRMSPHELGPVGLLRDAVHMQMNELEGLSTQHGVTVQLAERVGAHGRVLGEMLDKILAALDLERLDEVLLGGHVELAGDRRHCVFWRRALCACRRCCHCCLSRWQVGRVDVLEQGSNHFGSTVLDDHAALQCLLEAVREPGAEDGRTSRQNAFVRTEFGE